MPAILPSQTSLILRTRLRAVRGKGDPQEGAVMDLQNLTGLQVLRHCLNSMEFEPAPVVGSRFW